MSKLLKALALLLLVTTLVWGVTIWHWQRTPQELDSYQIAFHLVLLPAALSVVAWALYAFAGALLRHSPKAPVAAAGVAATAAPASEDPAAATAQAEARWTHALWSATAIAGPAATLDALAAELEAGTLRPAPDAELLDERGLPAFAARHAALDTEPVQQALDALHATLPSSPDEADAAPPLPPGERVIRALALLDGPLQDILPELAALAEPLRPERLRHGGLSPAAQAAPRFVAAGEAAAAASARPAFVASAPIASTAPTAPRLAPSLGPTLAPTLPTHAAASAASATATAHTPAAAFSAQLCLLTPAEWTSSDRELARRWLAGRLAAALPDLPLADAIRVQPCAQAEQGLQHIDRQLLAWRREGRRGLLLALAAESQIGADWVDRLAAHGLLFSGERPEGRVPGEAAVALLLSTPDWPAPEAAEPPLRLGRPVIARRSQPAGGPRVSATALRQAALQALGMAGLAPPATERGEDDQDLPPPAVPVACCDLDTRPSRSGEAALALQAAVPGLDPVAEVRALGQALGDVGLPRALLALALAARLVREQAAPALVFTVHDPLERSALVLAPAGPAAAASPVAPGAASPTGGDGPAADAEAASPLTA